MAQLNPSCLNTFFHHAAKCCIVTVNAPSVLIAKVTDHLRSAPVTLLDQGDGAVPIRNRHPAPGSCEPQKIVGALPASKWSAQAGVGRAGRADPKKSGTSGPPHRGFTEQWLGTRWAASNPFVARGQGRFGHRQASVALASGRRRCPIRSGGWSPTPLAGSPTTPYFQFRRRRDSRRSRFHRAGCNNRPALICGRPS